MHPQRSVITPLAHLSYRLRYAYRQCLFKDIVCANGTARLPELRTSRAAVRWQRKEGWELLELEYRDSGGEITRSICFGMFVFGLRPILMSATPWADR